MALRSYFLIFAAQSVRRHHLLQSVWKDWAMISPAVLAYQTGDFWS